MNERWPIFSEPWWLDAVAPGQWDELVVTKGDLVVARMPYVTTRRFGFKLLIMPPLTQNLGPWISSSRGKQAMKLSREHELMAALISQLPEFDLFMQQFHYSTGSWLPFYWKGFTQTTRYTYILTGIGDQEELWRGLRKNIRTDIRKARKTVAIEPGYDIDALMQLTAKTFARQSEKVPFSRAVVERVVNACKTRDCCRILVARDAVDRAHSAMLLVWDNDSAYYLIGGSDPDLRSSGATSLLIWEAIQLASTSCRVFDFEGSMIRPVERFFRGFGARPQAYHRVTMVNSKMIQLAMALAGESSRSLGKRMLGRA